MKTLLTICALAAGAGLYATSDSAQADHCRYGYGPGYRYSSPVFNGGRYYDYGRRHHHRRDYDRGYYSRRYDRGWGYDRGYYGRRGGFAIQTPGFGLYVR